MYTSLILGCMKSFEIPAREGSKEVCVEESKARDWTYTLHALELSSTSPWSHRSWSWGGQRRWKKLGSSGTMNMSSSSAFERWVPSRHPTRNCRNSAANVHRYCCNYLFYFIFLLSCRFESSHDTVASSRNEILELPPGVCGIDKLTLVDLFFDLLSHTDRVRVSMQIRWGGGESRSSIKKKRRLALRVWFSCIVRVEPRHVSEQRPPWELHGDLRLLSLLSVERSERKKSSRDTHAPRSLRVTSSYYPVQHLLVCRKSAE